MLRINLNFDRGWVEERRYDYENPVRIMEHYVKGFAGAEVIACSYNFLCVYVEAQKRNALLRGLEAFAREMFDEEHFWNHVQLDGDIGGWDPEEDGDYALLKEEKEEVPKELLKRYMAKDSMIDEEELTWQKKKEEVEEKYTQLIKNCQPLKDNPSLLAFTEKTKQLALTMARMGISECIWSKKLLISMDTGFGYSAFLEALAQIYIDCGVAEDVPGDKVMEILLDRSNHPTQKYLEWENAMEFIRCIAGETQEGLELKQKPLIVAMDLTKWQDELATPEILNYLKQIAESLGQCLCVFRVQQFEDMYVRELERILGSVMSIQALTAFPPSVEAMTEYLRNMVESKGFTVLPNNLGNWDLDCDKSVLQLFDRGSQLKTLEQWVSEEKRKPYFFGYRSLDRMAEQLVYKKAEINARKGVFDKVITVEDISELLENVNESEDPWEELDNLIGMQSVKEEIHSIVEQLRIIKDPKNRPTIHMKFVGPPGTGKTTVARLVARIFEKENLLKKGRYIEIHGRDLCSDHVGATAIRTKEYCRDAYGSVLFIDEAYELYKGKGSNDFGGEAVGVLIQQMENHRSDMCVILAGYKEDMDDLMTLNDGFADRLREVKFPNYERQELVQIFFKMLEADQKRVGLSYDEAVLRPLVEKFFLSEETLPESKRTAKEFGNARFVRNLFERVRGEVISRTGMDAEKELEIRPEDFESAARQFILVGEPKKTVIGFR